MNGLPRANDMAGAGSQAQANIDYRNQQLKRQQYQLNRMRNQQPQARSGDMEVAGSARAWDWPEIPHTPIW